MLDYGHGDSFRVLNRQTNRVTARCDVTFIDNQFPFKETQPLVAIAQEPIDSIDYEQAMKIPERELQMSALNDEIQSMHDNVVWDLVPRSQANGRLITGRWVLGVKEDGYYKARWVARGFNEPLSEDQEI